MMSLKPRNVNFDETWAKLKETVAGVVSLQAVDRSVWNARFSDVYALCVAHPEPLADRLYDETRYFLEVHVTSLLERVKGNTELESSDYRDGLLTRYVSAWNEYSQGVAYLNSLYSYLNMQHVKRHRISDAEIIYGTAAPVNSGDQESRQLEVGELGLVIWETVLLRSLGNALTARVVAALTAARGRSGESHDAHILREAILSTVHVQSFRVRAPLALYHRLVLEPFLSAAATHHATLAAQLLQQGDVSDYMRCVLEGLECEVALATRYLHAGSVEAARCCYERAYVAAHLPSLHAEAERLIREACGDHPKAEQKSVDDASARARRVDLHCMYTLLKPLGAQALRPLVDAAHAQAAREGLDLLAADHAGEEPHTHFVNAMLSLHSKYTRLFADVFGGAQAFVGALDKACSTVVNAREPGEPAKAPELLAKYCDALLRRRGADADADDKLASAIVVFKYVDDKDVFQKHYARALARRLIHQLSVSMEQEEAMINRLKAACGYEFTNKLHRMFTDIAVSSDLNTKFQQHLREKGLATPTGFNIQVLQAGAWPLGGAMAPLAPPAQLERPARLFEAFYRASFSGRRLAWLHHLCTGELRTRYTQRVYHVSATTPQCALLLMFETADRVLVREAQEALQLDGDSWCRHVRPVVDAGLLLADDVEGTREGSELVLNLSFSCKRTKIRLTCAANISSQATTPSASGGGASEATHCDDDRKMYLQAALVRIMKQRKVLRHTELIQEVVSQARGSFAPSVAMIKKCIEALIDKQYLERSPGTLDTYSYLA